jgi:imidazolonepropionase-like amidohydrolase
MRVFTKAPRMLDVLTGEVVPDALVVTEGERILARGPAASIQIEPIAGVDRVIEVADGTILPGFIEMHTHMHCSGGPEALQDVLTDSDLTAMLRGGQAMRHLLNAGVTTARDIGSKNVVAFGVREAVRRGLIAGPRLLVSGAPITTTGGHFYFMGLEADSVEEVVAAFRAQVKLGADHVKMMVSGGGFTPGTNTRRSQYRFEHVEAAVSESVRLHRPLVAHCHATEAIAHAAEAGVHDIVHCSWHTEDGIRVDERALHTIVDKGIYIDPTIAVGYRGVERALAGAAEMTPALAERRAARAARIEVVRMMLERGVRYIVGTDSGMDHTFHGDWALTPELFVREVGMTPLDALRAGTSVAAEALGRAHEIGSLAPGMLADITVVRGDPLTDITALYAVDTVIGAGAVKKQGGTLVEPRV